MLSRATSVYIRKTFRGPLKRAQAQRSQVLAKKIDRLILQCTHRLFIIKCLVTWSCFESVGHLLEWCSLVLITVQIDATAKLSVGCDKMIIGSMFLSEVKEALKVT